MDANEARARLTTLATFATGELRQELEGIARALDMPAPEQGPLGRFRELGLLGQGGMGRVLRVEDPLLGRTVALKALSAERAGELRERFVEEARVSAQLQHPAIVPVHELGVLPDGRPYFTMREVEGRTLQDVLLHGDWAQRRLLDVLLRVAEAVAYAHARGVVHRDLKPSNVMVGDFGEVFVVDWGIAKVVGALEAAPSTLREPGQADWTRYGVVLGTPVYMSPEQAEGDPEAIGPASDVWGLGAMLHEVLAGRPPLSGDAMQIAARLTDPDLAIRRPAGAPGDDALWALCEASLSREPASRPPHAGAFAAALQAFLDGARSAERARSLVQQAASRWPEADALRASADAFKLEARRAQADVPSWAPEERRHPLWEQEDRSVDLRVRADLAELAAEQGLAAALAEAPTLPEAHVALAERLRAQLEAAEDELVDTDADVDQVEARLKVARVRAQLQRHLDALPTAHPERVRHLAWLSGDAAITLATDVPARIVVERYEARHRRLVAVPVDEVDAPLVDLRLQAGSWRLRIRAPGRPEVLYPVALRRGERLALPTLSVPTDLPEGAIFVAPGWFQAGGKLPLKRRRLWCDGFVIQRFPVTIRDVCAFLNDLIDRGRVAEAERWAPQAPASRHGRGPSLLPRDDRGHFHPGPDPDGDMIEPDYPAMCMDWAGARAYAAWLRERTGSPWRLPGELEWEKAARGADGRVFPWGGSQPVASRCNCRDSRPSGLGPVVVDSFPLDESPYGMRGAAGNVRDWTADIFEEGWASVDGDRVVPPPLDPPEASHMVGRGGGWPLFAKGCALTARVDDRADYRHPAVGFRLACAWPPP